MIPLMSLMIGAYICARMLIHILRDDPRESSAAAVITRLVAIGTIILTIYCVIMINSAGIEMPTI